MTQSCLITLFFTDHTFLTSIEEKKLLIAPIFVFLQRTLNLTKLVNRCLICEKKDLN